MFIPRSKRRKNKMYGHRGRLKGTGVRWNARKFQILKLLKKFDPRPVSGRYISAALKTTLNNVLTLLVQYKKHGLVNDEKVVLAPKWEGKAFTLTEHGKFVLEGLANMHKEGAFEGPPVGDSDG